MEVKKLKPLTKEFLDQINFSWHTHEHNGEGFVKDEAIIINEAQVEAYYEATNELYDMFVEAGEYVIENDLFHDLDIPFNLVELIKDSWENDVHWHLYGRFDLAGGVDGKPIKLLEFNADTPTSLIETSIAQWALLKYNNLDDQKQFNNIYEAIKENFQRLITLSEDVSDFSKYYDGWKILFSSVRGNPEDEDTTRYLMDIADEAGFNVEFAYVDEVEFSEEGVFFGEQNYEYWFKLLPWESIAIEEGELATLLTQIVQNQKAIILNPAYTLLFQSKGILKVLWDLFPNHPLLLETSDKPLEGKAYVEKKCFGREGENVTIYDKDKTILDQKDGEYGNFKSIYQEYVELPKIGDTSIQAGIFFAYEACGLGFRSQDRLIIEDRASFMAHIVE